MDDDEMPDDVQSETDSINSEQDPIPWRSWLTARMPPNANQVIGTWRPPVWLALLMFALAVILFIAFHA
jgi:hypothetical protein